MLIQATRLRTTKRLLNGVPATDDVILGVRDIGRFVDRLTQIGFTEQLEAGERVLPAGVGPRTRYNAEGDYAVHRDQPMETAYRQTEWRWTEFRGRYDRVERADIRDVPYQRYPRTFRPPPSVELSIAAAENGALLVVADPIAPDRRDTQLLHVANVFLEIFGEVETLSDDLRSLVMPDARRLNWTVLPEGEHPWPAMRARLKPIVDAAPAGNRPVLFHRLEALHSFGPSFTAVGHGGFQGYVVFGFSDKKVFILESMYYGNATYVFGEDWAELSKLSKAQVLAGSLEIARVVHRRGWDAAIARLLA